MGSKYLGVLGINSPQNIPSSITKHLSSTKMAVTEKSKHQVLPRVWTKSHNSSRMEIQDCTSPQELTTQTSTRDMERCVTQNFVC